tara:strand:+ start:217 stop:429 length:213 start_codon:yes stop_codon:yes gene_type:complete
LKTLYIALEFPPVQTAGMFRSYEFVKRLHAKGTKLAVLLKRIGFVDLQFRGAGRFPSFWMTMVMSGLKPA